MPQTESAVSKRPKFESTLGALLSHPTRVAAYVILVEREASPNEIAQEIRKDVTHVGYHVRKLADMGHIEIVREEKVRGATEHFYKAVTRPFASEEDWAAMTPAERADITQLTLQLITTDAARAVDAGTFDRLASRWLLRLPFQAIDEEGFDELGEVFGRMYEEMLVVMGRAANRAAADPDLETFPAVAAAMYFERPSRRAGV